MEYPIKNAAFMTAFTDRTLTRKQFRTLIEVPLLTVKFQLGIIAVMLDFASYSKVNLCRAGD